MSEPTPEQIAALLRSQSGRLAEAQARVAQAPPPVEESPLPPPVEPPQPEGAMVPEVLKAVVMMLLDKLGATPGAKDALTGKRINEQLQATDQQPVPAVQAP